MKPQDAFSDPMQLAAGGCDSPIAEPGLATDVLRLAGRANGFIQWSAGRASAGARIAMRFRLNNPPIGRGGADALKNQELAIYLESRTGWLKRPRCPEFLHRVCGTSKSRTRPADFRSADMAGPT